MSDISTNLSMRGAKLFSTSEFLTCTIFNFKVFLFVLFIFVLLASIRLCNCENEQFSNNTMYSYKDVRNPSYSYYQSTALTSDDELLFGQANRYIHANETITTPNYILDIYANLFVLNGNPFGEHKLKIDDAVQQSYIVYLIDTKTSNSSALGKLKKDGDGIYKLHFQSTDPSKYINFDAVEIRHQTSTTERLVLRGKFNQL